jgi:hypothetical protein
MKLIDLKPTTTKQPPRIFITGTHGTGKTTLVSGAPSPLIFDLEDGSGQIEITRYPWQTDGSAPTFENIKSALTSLESEDHNFRTLIIDSVDTLESIIWNHTCDVESKRGTRHTSIEGFGYGKGYVLALGYVREFLQRLDRLRRLRSMAIVLVGHTHIRLFKNPEGDDYDRFVPRLKENAANAIKEWSDIVGFLKFEEGAGKGDSDVKSKGFSTGRRILHLERTAAFDAKCRYDLDPAIEISGADSWSKLMPRKSKK